MKPISAFALLPLLLAACSGSAPGVPPSPPPQAGRPAGEGVTWDNIHSGPGGSYTAPPADPAASPSLLKGNSPPQILSAQFVAGAGAGGDGIAVAVSGLDADGEPVTIEHSWTVNGKPAGTGIRLESAVRRGDYVTVTLTPFDGKERGTPVTLRSTINNVPPVIQGFTDVRQSGDSYSARIQAADPDGDPVRYTLVSGPSGMSVDPAEGTVKWSIPPDFKGRAVFSVAARDRSGAQSNFAATITVSESFE